MHIRAISRTAPVTAANVEVVLDVILQVLAVLEALERVLGVNIQGIFGKGDTTG